MILDLSVRLDDRTPAYPGDPRLEIKPAARVESDGYLGHRVRLGTHTGTHIDAPAHMIRGGKTLDKFPIDTFVGTAMCIDVSAGFDLDRVKAAVIERGDMVLFYTGMSQRYYDPEYFTDYPVMSAEIAEYLVKIGVKMVGLDTCSADNTPDFAVHKTLLGHDIPIIEVLTNLEQLVGKQCSLYALPLATALDGAPARVIATVRD